MRKFIELEPNMEEIVKRLEKLVISPRNEVYGLRKDVANSLGMTASNLSKSIERNSVPYSRLYSFARMNSISLDWILDGINLEHLLKRHEIENFEILITQTKGKIFQLLCLDQNDRLKEFKIIMDNLNIENRKMTKVNSSLLHNSNLLTFDLTLSELKRMGLNIKIIERPLDNRNYEYHGSEAYEITIDDTQYLLIRCMNFYSALNYFGILSEYTKNKEFREKSEKLFNVKEEEVIIIVNSKFNIGHFFLK